MEKSKKTEKCQVGVFSSKFVDADFIVSGDVKLDLNFKAIFFEFTLCNFV